MTSLITKQFFLASTLLTSTLVASLNTANADSLSAEQIVEKMLERLGGKSDWARLTSTINGSIQNRAIEPTEVYSVITMDFEQPRFSIETTAPNVYLKRVINGDDSWRISWAGVVEDMPAAGFEEDIAWYQAHVYRTIHRIAKDDPKLSVRLSNGKLEIIEDASRLLWFKLDAKAEPYAFGFRDDEAGSLCGPWTVDYDGIKQPRWVSHADGTWRAAVQVVQFNTPLHDSLFTRPVE